MGPRENDTYFTAHLPGEHYRAVCGAPTAPTESVSSQSPPIGTSLVSGCTSLHAGAPACNLLCLLACVPHGTRSGMDLAVDHDSWIVVAKSLRHLARYAA